MTSFSEMLIVVVVVVVVVIQTLNISEFEDR